ncbi:L-desosaminyltransferase [Nonomuraea polychroma]|uniref:L-desosaminyltransferase n=1 Tax=Nonomuraea polychroma TaxID=46176 RepID=A0A438LZU9_9ACTN|nr:nucleotide disphospho-sugar-binding domain-containing protein [Nonomuraea polychroma]RVX38768.1 L-desosaminyltransferase [Nonomuraea polychroma]
MRVLFIPAAVPSHFYPMAPLAWAFQSAGHEVYVAGQPPVVDSIVAAGLQAVPVGGAYDLMANITAAGEIVRRETGEGPSASGDVSSMSPEAFRRYAELRILPHVRTAAAMLDELAPFARAWRPDLVVSDPITLVAPLIAAAAGAPLVHHLWGPLPERGTLTEFPGYSADPGKWPAELRDLYDLCGVEPAAYPAVASIEPGPPSLQAAAIPKRLPARYVPFNGSGALPAWLRESADRPRVCVSWLTSNTTPGAGESAHPLATLVSALAAEDVETLVAVRAWNQTGLEELPGGVRVVVDLPLNIVLPTCAVSVNHGGVGTTMTALHHGVPQVVVPYNPGAVYEVQCLIDAGAAVAVDADPIDAGEVASAAVALAGDCAQRKAAAVLREENLAQPAPAQVVGNLEELLG